MHLTHYSRTRQQGGTILGLIIGLVVGLTIAVVVALVITNTTLPFGNKFIQQTKGAMPTLGQIEDPNKPLYANNEPAKQAAKEFQKGEEVSLPVNKPTSEKNAVVSDVGKSEVKDITKEADPKISYFLQTGAFRDSADVENAKAKLALLGFDVHIVEKQDDVGVLYRVRIGPFIQIETMNKSRNKLIENGMDVAVVRFSKS